MIIMHLDYLSHSKICSPQILMYITTTQGIDTTHIQQPEIQTLLPKHFSTNAWKHGRILHLILEILEHYNSTTKQKGPLDKQIKIHLIYHYQRDLE